MTQEERSALLNYLCGALYYGVMCDRLGETKKLLSVTPSEMYCLQFDNGEYVPSSYRLEDCKPYLRPMSSMTEDERKEVENLIKQKRPYPYGEINNKGMDNLLFSVSVTSGVLIEWLNKKHFDYKGFIAKGLAIEVTEENNPYKDY